MSTKSVIPMKNSKDFEATLGASMDFEVDKVQATAEEQWYAKYEELKARRDKWNEEGHTHNDRNILHRDEVAVGIHTGKWPRGMAPRSSCNTCYGRGYEGKSKEGKYFPCKCIAKYMQ